MKSGLLDVEVGKVVGKRAAGSYGVELEIEGDEWPDLSMDYWLVKEEGSLRGGWEFVLPRPVDDLGPSLAELEKKLSQVKNLRKSLRCSTHIHINVTRMTQYQLYRGLFLYYLLEDLLVRTQGPLRMGNLFCLRMSDAEAITSSLQAAILNEQNFSMFSQGNMKYGALNLAAIPRFGSVEFRFLRPLDTAKIDFWAKLFKTIMTQGGETPTERFLDLLDRQDYQSFLNLAMAPAQSKVLTEGLSIDDIEGLLTTNYGNVQHLSRLLERKRKKKFSIPEEYLDDDLVGSPYRLLKETALQAEKSTDFVGGYV